MELKTILVTQARVGSTRLPGKILKEIDGKTLLQIHLTRLALCKKVSKIIVATTTSENDDIIFDKSIQKLFEGQLQVFDEIFSYQDKE